MTIEVRFADTDAMGHVNNATYLTYCEIARIKYWTDVTGVPIDHRITGLEKADPGRSPHHLPGPAFYGETVTVETRAARVGVETVVSSSSIALRLRCPKAAIRSSSGTTTPQRGRSRCQPSTLPLWRHSRAVNHRRLMPGRPSPRGVDAPTTPAASKLCFRELWLHRGRSKGSDRAEMWGAAKLFAGR